MAAGDALNDLRRDIGVRNRWWYWRNYLNFNLWGDPSVGIYSYRDETEEPVLDGDMGVVDIADAELSEEPLDMEVIDDLDAMLADDAETSDMGLGGETFEEDAQRGIADVSPDQADMSTAVSGSESGCHVSNTSGQAPGWGLFLCFGGLIGLRRRAKASLRASA